MERRVVVTGVGMISPLGIGTQETWDGLLAGRSGVGPITRFDATDYACRIAGEVRGFDPAAFMPAKDVKKCDLFIQYALAATQFAVEDSRLDDRARPTPSASASTSDPASAGSPPSSGSTRSCSRRGPRRISPFFIVGLIVNMGSGQVSIRYGAKGPNLGELDRLLHGDSRHRGFGAADRAR